MSRSESNDVGYSQPGPLRVALGNRCPRCGEGKLFTGMLEPGKSCSHCGLDYGFIDSGDGPAVFVILIIGFFVTALAMTFETAFSPPVWLHVILWGPLVLLLSIWGLRVSKGIMISLQYQTKAHEGVIGDRE